MNPTPLRIILSDLHLGEGHQQGRPNPLDDFTEDARFAELLDHWGDQATEERPVELILNGDIVDLLKVRVRGIFPEVVDEACALTKLERIIEGHSMCFDALKRFSASPFRRIVYLPGNHDIDLVFPMVAERIRLAMSADPSYNNVHIIRDTPVLYLDDTGVIITHGHQAEAANAFNYDHLFIDQAGPPVLNLPWGSFFVLSVINRFKERRPHLDRVRPFAPYVIWALLFDFRFTVRFLMTCAYHIVRTRLFPSAQRKARWRTTVQLALDEFQFSPPLESYAATLLRQSPGFHTVICGHNHRAAYHPIARGQYWYVNTGTWGSFTTLSLRSFGTRSSYPFALIDPSAPDAGQPLVQLLEWRGESRRYHNWRL
ncbi:MAG: metallophosphoesterase [Myxococcota bacterium]|nr:metallophosphoesterase [Myxococcota bacterium]